MKKLILKIFNKIGFKIMKTSTMDFKTGWIMSLKVLILKIQLYLMSVLMMVNQLQDLKKSLRFNNSCF